MRRHGKTNFSPPLSLSLKDLSPNFSEARTVIYHLGISAGPTEPVRQSKTLGEESDRRGRTPLEPRSRLDCRDECVVSFGVSTEHQHSGAILELGLADS